jgi:hypothetical protein
MEKEVKSVAPNRRKVTANSPLNELDGVKFKACAPLSQLIFVL